MLKFQTAVGTLAENVISGVPRLGGGPNHEPAMHAADFPAGATPEDFLTEAAPQTPGPLPALG
jgi:hypothetical protein